MLRNLLRSTSIFKPILQPKLTRTLPQIATMSSRKITDFFSKPGSATKTLNGTNSESRTTLPISTTSTNNGENGKTEGTPVKGRMSLKRESPENDSPTPTKRLNLREQQSTKEFDPPSYDPSKKKYDPIDDSVWSAGSPVPYMAWSRTLQKIEEESSRLRMIEILSNFLSSIFLLTPDEVVPTIYLCCNKVAPNYEGLELGVGDGIIVGALAQATGSTVKEIQKDVTEKGDLGLVAESSRSKQPKLSFAVKPKPLTVKKVYQSLRDIAKMSGGKSQDLKKNKILQLLRDCQGNEAKYLVRSLQGKLRIGLAEQSLLCSIAQAVVVFENPEINRNSDEFKSKAEVATCYLKEAYCDCPNFDRVVGVILKDGLSALPEKCRITPGIPLKPMLSHPSKGVSDILKRFDQHLFTCEYKYDGERAQVHVNESGQVSIYSRNQENHTEKYPDIVSAIPKVKKAEVKDCILDTEAVAWDRESNKILPFQVLSTRKRKDVKEDDITVRVCIFAFDMLYVNGQSLTKKTLRERRDLLRSSFDPIEGIFMFAQGKDVTTTEEIEELVDVAVKDRCEGLMVKSLDHGATYEIAKRSHNWLKLKKDYLDGVSDSLDLVVIGAWHGKGKRHGTFGAFLLACYNTEEEEWQTICKIGTGFTDDDLDKHHETLSKCVLIDKDGKPITTPPSYYKWSHDPKITPNVWFEPIHVWEVKCADLSISPVHTAAVGRIDDDKGVSLRFPRFVRIRDDKKAEDATNSEQVADMYLNQESIKESGGDGATAADDEDY